MVESNLDRMKKAAANKPKPAASPPAVKIVGTGESKPKPPAKPKTEKGPVVEKIKVMVDSVEFKCGHTISAAQFKTQACFACIKSYRLERANKKKAKNPHVVVDMGGATPGRLPDGATKIMRWSSGVWFGHMTVPGVETEFRVEENTEKRCLYALHNSWIAWLSSQPKPEPTPPPPG